MNYKEVYESLDTLEAKLQFLVDLQVLATNTEERSNKDESLKESAKELIDLAEDLTVSFVDEYVIGQDNETRAEVMKALGAVNARAVEEVYQQGQIYANEYPVSDPNREAKGEFFANMRFRGGGLKLTLSSLTSRIQEDIRKDYDEMDRRWDAARVDEQTTWADFARLAGYDTPEKAKEYLEAREVKDPNASVLEVMTEEVFRRNTTGSKKDSGYTREDARQMAVKMLKFQMYESQIKNSLEKASDAYLQERHGEETYQRLKEAQRDFFKSYGPDEQIEEWAKEEGFPKLDALEAEDLEQIRTELEEKTERLLAQQKGAAQLFPWMEDGAQKLTEEEIGQYRKLTGLDLGDEGQRLVENSGSLMQVKDYKADYAQALGATDRPPTVNSIFTIWALGTQEQIDLSNFTKAAEDPELVKKFAEFCRNNPTREATDRETFEKSCKAWGEALKKGTDKLRQYRIPEIDWHDPDAVRRVLPEMAKIRALTVDFDQEKDTTFWNPNFDGKRTVEEQIGRQNWKGMLDFWGNLQNGLGAFNAGFVEPGELHPFDSMGVTDEVVGKAVNRAVAIRDMTQNAGKTLDDMMKGLGEKRVLGFPLALDSKGIYMDGEPREEFREFVSFTKEEAYDFLLGNNTAVFEQKVRQFEEDQLTIKRTKTPKLEAWEGIKRFQGYGSEKDWEILGQLPEDAQGVAEFIQNGKMEGKDAADWLAKGMRELFHDNFQAIVDRSGYEPLELFSIDGKTPEELWGAKYAKITDPALRERCLQMELMRQITRCEADIRLKYFAVAEDGTLSPDGEVTVFPGAATLQRVQQGLENYKKGAADIVSELKDYERQLLSTHSHPESAEEEIGEVGSKGYQQMEWSLHQCILMFEDGKYSREDIEKSLLAFQQAAEEYELERLNETNRGAEATRTQVAALTSSKLPGILTRYRSLREGIDADIATATGLSDRLETMQSGGIFYIEDALEKINKGKQATYQAAMDKLPKEPRQRDSQSPESRRNAEWEGLNQRLVSAAKANQAAEKGVWFGSKEYENAKEAYLKAVESYRKLHVLSVAAPLEERQKVIEEAQRLEREATEKIGAYLDTKDAATKDQKAQKRIAAMKDSLKMLDDLRVDLDEQELELDEKRIRSTKIRASVIDEQNKSAYRGGIEQDAKTLEGSKKIAAMGAKAALEQLEALTARQGGELTAKEMESARLCMASVVYYEVQRKTELRIPVKGDIRPEAAYAQAIKAFAASKEFSDAVKELDMGTLREFEVNPKQISRQVLENLRQAGLKKGPEKGKEMGMQNELQNKGKEMGGMGGRK
ncbi:MAG: hypothetical protein IKS07_05725 [Lachnospiraceae bacterium]|nr:hypothetical protein [Lachnospiraceae bacterium]